MESGTEPRLIEIIPTDESILLFVEEVWCPAASGMAGDWLMPTVRDHSLDNKCTI